MHKSNTLFDLSKLERKEIPSQSKFIDGCSIVIEDFYRILHESFDELKEEIERKDPLEVKGSWKALTINNKCNAKLTRLYPTHVLSVNNNGSNFRFEGFDLCINKLQNDFIPKGNNTKRSYARLSQKSLNISDTLPVIYLGYQVNKNFEYIKGVYAVCKKNEKEISWITDISALIINKNLHKYNEDSNETQLKISVNLKSLKRGSNE